MLGFYWTTFTGPREAGGLCIMGAPRLKYCLSMEPLPAKQHHSILLNPRTKVTRMGYPDILTHGPEWMMHLEVPAGMRGLSIGESCFVNNPTLVTDIALSHILYLCQT